LTTGPTTAARIARIEAGLMPAVIIKGRPSPAMRLADRMKAYGVPGLSIAFVERGKVAWTRTYGYADVARRAPVTDRTLFAAASISKPLTALAALRLVQDGKLVLDEDVNARLRSWKVPESDLTRRQKVTLRGLLSHTAGIANQVFKGYAPTDPLPSVAQVLRGESPASSSPVVVETVPGTAQQYSNAGYLIVQQLLTDVTGRPFPELLKNSVLGPAGMRHSTFEQPLLGKWRDAAEYEWPALRAREHSVVEVDPAALSRYVGRYELPGLDTLTVTMSGGRLLLQSRALGGEPRELLAESDTRFFLLDPAAVFEFRLSPDGAVTGLGAEVNGQVHEARVVR
jgi:CubicO group peptidase (beta-lactamase class C family)